MSFTGLSSTQAITSNDIVQYQKYKEQTTVGDDLEIIEIVSSEGTTTDSQRQKKGDTATVNKVNIESMDKKILTHILLTIQSTPAKRSITNATIIPEGYLVRSPSKGQEGCMKYNYVRYWKQANKSFEQGQVWQTVEGNLVLLLFMRTMNTAVVPDNRK